MIVVGDTESVNLSTGERHRRVVGDGESRLEIDRGFVDVRRLGPSDEIKFGPREGEPTVQEIVKHAEAILSSRRRQMHYRNGREAKNGDKIVKLNDKGEVVAFGVLHSATPGNDYCNGTIAVIQSPTDYACMVDCLHNEDVAALLKAKELDKRPSGK